MGSNLLIADEGFDGVIVKAAKLNLEIEPQAPDPQTGRVRIRTGASVAISSFLRRACLEGWGDLEFLTGIPGSIGGAVFMNAGTHLGETCERLRAVEYFDLQGEGGKVTRVEGSGLGYQYRKNLYLPPAAVVWAAEWETKAESAVHVKEIIDQTLARRKATQPIDLPSCGSVFKNPRASGLSAWQVIDELGLRGHRIGGAEFSPKHCNFIVNVGGARSGDVHGLIQLAKAKARERLGIELEEEVRYVGHFSSSRV
jgi:UDP-N-acetylmuramate dehydrogenase